MTVTGTLYGVGVGPGDPELITVKAARIIREAPVVAFFAKDGATGHARRIAGAYLTDAQEELRFTYPYTVEISKRSTAYRQAMSGFYDAAAARLAAILRDGRDVALLCEGDPFFYGSFMYPHDRLADAYPVQVVPGVTAMTACWDRAGVPMTRGDDCLTVLPGTLDEAALCAQLGRSDATVIMKVGRHLPKIRRALDQAGLLDRAILVEHGSMVDEMIVPLGEKQTDDASYFSIVLVPTERVTS
ncbi:MAG: precorrin-2 C(20)-methyltransferase [Rhodospirillaceae bacterium]|nr:precorrin-2 C(20)-methyltransferase [Rhodospirillaceae bacterium]MCY4239642.1 precorrin-2 C(20)-methyltransferase [Rhodospirillaceae bacterium]MCY4311986.1 precorrin-2 C(20)-methyltransferase [Rhodospirillaceae bacterium]